MAKQVIVVSEMNILELVSPPVGEQMTLERLNADLENNKAMELCVRLHRNLKAMEQFQNDLELSKAFRGCVQHFFGKSKQLAATYLHNIRTSEKAGGDLYASNKKWNKKLRDQKRSEREAANPTPEVATAGSIDVLNQVAENAAPVIEPEVPEVITTAEVIEPSPTIEQPQAVNDDDSRWGVLHIDTNVIEKFVTRGAAQEHNRVLKTEGKKVRLWDKTKDQMISN